jgi:hypothetical protein
VAESAAKAARPKEVAGARPASQGPQLGALARAQLSGALRLVSADVADDVERFCEPHLVAAGKVGILSLETIQNSFGDRWSARRDEVFAFTAKLLGRKLGSRGVFLRVSDSDFLVIHPHLGRIPSQAASLGYLREILTHFLGEATHAVRDILEVTRIGKGRLETEAVDAAKVEAFADAGDVEFGDRASTRLAPLEDEADAGGSRLLSRRNPFTAADGRTLRITATLEPVYELKGFTRIGFRMIRRVIVVETGEELTPQQVSALASIDLLRADLATITRGIDRLRGEGAGEQQLSLIVPVSFSSLSNPRGRAQLVEPVREAATLVKLGVILEIADIEGVPQSALLEVTSLLRPLSLLVVGRLAHATAGALARLHGAGFQALSFECPHGQVGDAEFLGWASATTQAARKVAKSVLVYRAGSMQRGGLLASLGATHVSLDAG